MSTTTSIKVTYDSVSRRFSIPTDSPNWLDLERQIRTLFQIPALKINVFYIDEDGDEITVSSDLELEEILKQFTYNNKNKPIKLVVTTLETSDTSTISATNAVTAAINASPNKIEDESWVIEGGANNNDSSDGNNNSSKEKQKNVITPYKMADSGGDSNTTASTVNYQHVSFVDESEEEEEEKSPLFVDYKENSEKIDNKNKNVDIENNNKDDNNNKNREAENDEDNEFIIYITSDNPWHNSFLGLNRGGYNRCNGRFNFYGPPSQFCRQRFNENGTHNNNSYNYNNCGGSYRQPKSCYNRTAEENTDLSDKVKILNEMGFPEAKNAKHEILLRKFNGNIERVVEVLLYWQQNDHYGANKHDNHRENNGGGSTSSNKEVDEVY